MVDNFIAEVRKISNFSSAVLSMVELDKNTNTVTVSVITDSAYAEDEKSAVLSVAQKFVPDYFSCKLVVKKVTPDCDMIKRKVLAFAGEGSQMIASTLRDCDVTVQKTEGGFTFQIAVTGVMPSQTLADGVAAKLKTCFCGEFSGTCVLADVNVADIEVEEKEENVEYVIPVRTFAIENYKEIEGFEHPKTAVYISDMNFESESVSVCGTVDHVEERSYASKKDGSERKYLVFTVNDGTAGMRVTCFPRKASLDKLNAIAEGDSIVCTGKSDLFNGAVRFTTKSIDYGTPPKNFVPEKRPGKPVPKYYELIKPQPYVDFSQTDMFAQDSLPDCLKNNVFVVLDLETTGRNSSPSAGNMDRIIEIGACKIENGVIKESFSTLINPGRKLSAEIVELTGINDEMLVGAPTYEQVMPDFYKFCHGCYLVGHNIAGFDFKFIDHYWQQLGYVMERKIFDTFPMAQSQLYLKNYKLNTIADYYGLTFNHHRALDDTVVTAKIFMELVKAKKSLPKLC